MQRLTALIALILALGLALPALSADAAPELRGTWKGKTFVNTADGFREGGAAFVIEAQAGQLFKGYKLYFNKGVLQKEAFTGLFAEDGSLYFAENADGYAFGKLTGKQTMSVYYLEDGATYKSMLYKLERLRFTTGFLQIDRDGDKAIVRAEITNYYPLNAERIMKEADTNKDGKLTEKEWNAWRQTH